MIINRSFSKHGSYCPAALNLLAGIPASLLFNVQHQLRHPDSIYRLSLEKFGVAFCKVAELYLDITQKYEQLNPEVFEIDDLLARQRYLLHAVQEHLDEFWLILKALIDPSGTNCKERFADKFVLANRLPGAKTFAEAIAPYRKSLRIVNKLKHQQGHLRAVAMWTTCGPHFGYFLEEPDREGVLGPSPEIHPDQKAFSFSRDLLWHLVNVYDCSEKLGAVIQKVIKAKGLTLPSGPRRGVGVWEKVVSTAIAIPHTIFPGDLKRGLPSVFLNEQSEELTLAFPRRIQILIPKITKVSCSFKIDGYSPSCKVPLI